MLRDFFAAALLVVTSASAACSARPMEAAPPPVSPSPGSYEGLAGTRTRLGDEKFGNTGYSNVQAVTAFKAADMIRTIKIGWSGATVRFGGPGCLGNPLTVKAAIEYPIGAPRQPLMFNGGATGTMANCSVLLSDYLTLKTPIPAGAKARVWFRQSTSGAATDNIYYSDYGRDTDPDGDVWAFNGSDVTYAGGAPAQQTSFPSSGPLRATTSFVPLAAVISQTMTRPSGLLLGDSIASAQPELDTPQVDGRVGLARGFPNDLPFLILAYPAAQMNSPTGTTGWLAQTRAAGLDALFPYVSFMINQGGINDKDNRVSNGDLKAAQETIASAFPARVKKFAMTLGFGAGATTSSDGFTTLAGQSLPSGAASLRSEINSWNKIVRANGIRGYADYFDYADAIMTARDSHLWKVGPGRAIIGTISSPASGSQFTDAAGGFLPSDAGCGLAVPTVGNAAATLNYASYIQRYDGPTQVTGWAGVGRPTSGLTAYVCGYTHDGLHPIRRGFETIAATGWLDASKWAMPAPAN